MRTIVVDDEVVSREMLVNIAGENKRISKLQQFENAEDALEYVKNNKIDLAILDILLPEMDGVELAKKLHKIDPRILFVFETCREDYALNAYQLKAVSYLVKPFNEKDIAYALESAYLLKRRSPQTSPFYARTFGHFDFFVDGTPVAFKSAKAKELLALLVDRQGGIVTSEQMIAALWEDRPNDDATQNLACKVTKALQNELKRVNADNVIHIERGMRSINVNMIECDLYSFFAGDEDVLRHYCGYYLSDYSWGEYRIPILDRIWKNDKSTSK